MNLRSLAIAALVALAVFLYGWYTSRRRTRLDALEGGPKLATLDDAAAALEAARLGPVRRYSTFDFGRERDPANISVIARTQDGEPLVRALRRRLGPGLVAYVGTSNWLGDESHMGRVEVVIGRGASQLDILRLARSDAVNYDMQTEDLVKKLADFDARFGIEILHAETDTIECAILCGGGGNPLPRSPLPAEGSRDPPSWKELAKDLYAFCPDIVDQGTESVEALEQELRRHRRIYLWWD